MTQHRAINLVALRSEDKNPAWASGQECPLRSLDRLKLLLCPHCARVDQDGREKIPQFGWRVGTVLAIDLAVHEGPCEFCTRSWVQLIAAYDLAENPSG